MPPDLKGKSHIRSAPYDALRLPQSSNIASSGQLGQQRSSSSNFMPHLSTYLKLKNEAYKAELENMEEELNKAEETTKNLKEEVTALAQTVIALESTVDTATNILSASLLCTICVETCSNPTSLKCGHTFCRDCLQSWFLNKFESKCEGHKIELTRSQYRYIYTPSSTADGTERNMIDFSELSNRLNPKYDCPSCRDPMLPSIRNSFHDFKLASSLNALNALTGYPPVNPPEWRLASIDMLAFLNSQYFRIIDHTFRTIDHTGVIDINESVDVDESFYIDESVPIDDTESTL